MSFSSTPKNFETQILIHTDHENLAKLGPILNVNEVTEYSTNDKLLGSKLFQNNSKGKLELLSSPFRS